MIFSTLYALSNVFESTVQWGSYLSYCVVGSDFLATVQCNRGIITSCHCYCKKL